MQVNNINNTNFTAKRVLRLKINNNQKPTSKTYVDIIKLNPKEDTQFMTQLYLCVSNIPKNISSEVSKIFKATENFTKEFLTHCDQQSKEMGNLGKDYYIGLRSDTGVSFGYTLNNKAGGIPYHQIGFTNSTNQNLQNVERFSTFLHLINQFKNQELPNAKSIEIEMNKDNIASIDAKNILNIEQALKQQNPNVKIEAKPKAIKDLEQYLDNIQKGKF